MSKSPHASRLTPYLVDTHAHLDSYSDVAEVIKDANEAGVAKIVLAAFSLPCSRFNVDVAKKFSGLYPAVGVHPHSARDLDKEAKKALSSLAEESSIVAIGETGLDFHYFYSEKEQQIDSFKWHINLANTLNLPLIVHSRQAAGQSLQILEEEGRPRAGFVLHAFSGSPEEAQHVFAAGGLISVTGVVTFKNAPELQELVKQVELEKMMVETDSPYLSPEPFRGQTNEPKNVVKVAEKIAGLKGLTFEEVAKETTANAKRFFRF